MKVWLVVDSSERPIGGSPDLEVARGIRAKARSKCVGGFQLRAVEIEGIRREDSDGRDDIEAKSKA